MVTGSLTERSVFDYLLLRQGSTVPQVAERLRLPSSTAVSALNRLQAKGLVGRRHRSSEIDHGSLRRGRPTLEYHVRLPGTVAAFMFGGTQLTGAIFDQDGSVQASKTLEMITVTDPQQAIVLLEQLLSGLLIEAKIDRHDVMRVALSLNAVRTQQGVLTSSVLPWVTEGIDEMASQALRLPVELAQGGPLLAEYLHLPEPAPETLLHFRVDDGVSCHSIIHGQASVGRNHLSGELGHVTVDPNGPMCGCGKRGCLEAYAGASAICRRLFEERTRESQSLLDLHHLHWPGTRVAMEHVWQCWQRGDELTQRVMGEVLDRIAWGLSLAVNMYDPDLVRVGGHVLLDRGDWIRAVKERTRPHLIRGAERELVIEPAKASVNDQLRLAAYSVAVGG